MKISVRKGFGFGLTSGIITTLGLLIGLYSSTYSKLAVIGGIIIIAIADALSDSLGMHISEESYNTSHKKVLESTYSTFVTKFITALTFIIPILFLSLGKAVVVSILWGLVLIILFNIYLVKLKRRKSYKIIFEHLSIAIIVIIVAYFVGRLVNLYFS